MLFRLSHGMGSVNSMLLLPVISSVQKGHDGMRVYRVIVVVAYQPEETFWASLAVEHIWYDDKEMS